MTKPTADQYRVQDLLSARFENFNRLYFGSRLPPYRIAVLVRVSGTIDAGGHCDRKRRLIRLRHEPEETMVGNLLHEMVLAATGVWHGKMFWAEIQRLHEAGAPVAPCDLLEPIRATAASVRNGIDDRRADGVTLRKAQSLVARCFGLNGAELLRRFPRAAKGSIPSPSGSS